MVGGDRMGEIEDLELLVQAAGDDTCGRGLLRKGDRLDDVGVLEGVEAFAGVRIPDLAEQC